MHWFYVQRLELSRMADDLHFFPFKGGIYLNLLDPKFYRKFGIQVRGHSCHQRRTFFSKNKRHFYGLHSISYYYTPQIVNIDMYICMHKNNKHQGRHRRQDSHGLVLGWILRNRKQRWQQPKQHQRWLSVEVAANIASLPAKNIRWRP